MSLQRQTLRDDLAAVIAAGRELPPDHDYVLADLFLERAQRQGAVLRPSPGTLDRSRRRQGAVAVACAALATGTLWLAAIRAAHPVRPAPRSSFAPGLVAPNPFGGGSGINGNQALQPSPWAPQLAPRP